jgi:XTP/dITP diphosphohydrolase
LSGHGITAGGGKRIRLQEKSRQVGFEESFGGVWAKGRRGGIVEVLSGDPSHIEEEFGDLMFSLINYARFAH